MESFPAKAGLAIREFLTLKEINLDNAYLIDKSLIF